MLLYSNKLKLILYTNKLILSMSKLILSINIMLACSV